MLNRHPCDTAKMESPLVPAATSAPSAGEPCWQAVGRSSSAARRNALFRTLPPLVFARLDSDSSWSEARLTILEGFTIFVFIGAPVFHRPAELRAEDSFSTPCAGRPATRERVPRLRRVRKRHAQIASADRATVPRACRSLRSQAVRPFSVVRGAGTPG